MKFKVRSYPDGFGGVRSVLELDAWTRQQVVESMDPDREDPSLHPWKRSFGAAIRRALGH
jgi:hypothetical protein